MLSNYFIHSCDECPSACDAANCTSLSATECFDSSGPGGGGSGGSLFITGHMVTVQGKKSSYKNIQVDTKERERKTILNWRIFYF